MTHLARHLAEHAPQPRPRRPWRQSLGLGITAAGVLIHFGALVHQWGAS